MKLHVAFKIVNSDIHSLTMFADNCGGQNKNCFMVEMLATMVIKLNLNEIVLIYFILKQNIHDTHNINDNVYSVIERAKKGVNIHHPCQWFKNDRDLVSSLIENVSGSNPLQS